MRKRIAITTVILAAAAGLALPVHAQNIDWDPSRPSYIVLGEDGVLPVDLEDQVAAAGGTVTRVIPQIGVAVVRGNSHETADVLMGGIGIHSVTTNVSVQWQSLDNEVLEPQSPAVEEAGVEMPSDPLFNVQWALDAIDAPEAWDLGARGAGVRIVVLDGAVKVDHPDLIANVNLDLSTSFVDGEGFALTEPTTRSHGTYVAGLMAADDNDIGIVGVAPDAEIVVVRILDDNGMADWGTIIAGIVYAADAGADVINMSFGEVFDRHGYCVEDPETGDQLYCVSAEELSNAVVGMTRAVQYAFHKGATMVTAIGNLGIDHDHTADFWHIPPMLPHTLAVSATAPLLWAYDQDTDLDVPTFYTHYGRSAIDLAAPGGTFDFGLRFPPDGNPGAEPNDEPEVCTVHDVTRPCWESHRRRTSPAWRL